MVMDLVTYRQIYLSVIPSINLDSHYRWAIAVGKFFDFMKSELGFLLLPIFVFHKKTLLLPPSTSPNSQFEILPSGGATVDVGGWWRWHEHDNITKVARGWPLRHCGCWLTVVIASRWRSSSGSMAEASLC